MCTFAISPLRGAGFAIPGPIPTAKDAALPPLLCFGDSGTSTEPGHMSNPSAVTVGELSAGTRIFVADTENDRIQEWAWVATTTEFRWARHLGASGRAPGAFDRPVGLALLPSPSRDPATSKLFVSESRGARAQVVSADGRPLQVLTLPVAGRLGGVCVATRHNVDASADAHRLIVAGRESHRLFVFRRSRKKAVPSSE